MACRLHCRPEEDRTMCLVRSLPGAPAPTGALCTRCGIVVRLGCILLHVTATFIHMLLSHAALLCRFLPIVLHCRCTLLYSVHVPLLFLPALPQQQAGETTGSVRRGVQRRNTERQLVGPRRLPLHLGIGPPRLPYAPDSGWSRLRTKHRLVHISLTFPTYSFR